VPGMAGGPPDLAVDETETGDPAGGGVASDHGDQTSGSEAAPSEPVDAAECRRNRLWWAALAVICLVGLGIRVGYVVSERDVDEVGDFSYELGANQLGDGEVGDDYYYHAAANLLADGQGFVHPFFWDDGIRAPGADHPPGYAVALAIPSLLGMDGVRAHQLTTVLIGVGTIALIALVARRLAGRRAGLLAAGFAAVYPNLWLNDGALMSETLALFLGVVVIVASYRAWDEPSWRRFAVLGLTIGLASLARAEAALLLGLLVVPLAVWVKGLDGWRVRAERAVVAGGVTVLVLAPWVVANLVRFEEPATLSTQMGPTLGVANCDQTYGLDEAFGNDFLGSWSFACATAIDGTDRSVLDKVTRDQALDYMSEHKGRLPAVFAARFGRTWGLYDPDGQVRLDNAFESRPLASARVGLAMYYGFVALGIVGLVWMRRRRLPSFPLTTWLLNVAITVVAFYGSTRFRAPAEPSIVILAAVGAEASVRRWLPSGKSAEEEPPLAAPAG
jgi:4-amino-4-deoxy-L-arabinose transferase-like glycosyltransferase